VRWDIESASYTEYKVEDGLAHNVTAPLALAPDGTLWIGTLNGLSHFDPQRSSWDLHTTREGLADNTIDAMAVLSDGTVWVVTASGISKLASGSSTWQTETYLGRRPWRASDVIVGKGDFLWFTSDHGIARLDPSANTWRYYAPRLAGMCCRRVIQADNGALWVNTCEEGVYRYDPAAWLPWTRWTHYTAQDGLGSNVTYATTFDMGGGVWIGTEAGVSHRTPTGWVTYTAADGLPHSAVWSAAGGTGEELWFGTQRGLVRFDPSTSTWQSYTTAAPPFMWEAWIRPLVAAPDNSVWTAQDRQPGVLQLTPDEWRLFTYDEGKRPEPVHALTVAEDRKLWIGSRFRVSTLDPGLDRWEHYTESDGLLGNWVEAVLVAGDESVWFGSSSGLSHFTPGTDTWVNYRARTNSFPDMNIKSLATWDGRDIWAGGNPAVLHIDGESWTLHTRDDGVPVNPAGPVIAGPGGRVWVGSRGGGLGTYDGTTWSTLSFPTRSAQMVGVNSVTDLAVAPNGTLWAIVDGELFSIDPVAIKWRPHRRVLPLAGRPLISVAITPDGAVWLGTDYAVFRYTDGD
jgi:ligand-binding sensor domain-containing protein